MKALPLCTCPHRSTLPAVVLTLLASGAVGIYARDAMAFFATALAFQLVDHWIGRVVGR